MTTPEQIAGLTELENLVTQLEAWEGMISAGYQCPAAGISMLNAAKHLADIAHKLRTGKLIVVDHLQATSPVDDRETPNVSDKQAVEAVARAIMIARDNGGCIVKDWQKEAKDNCHVAQALRQAQAAIAALKGADHAG